MKKRPRWLTVFFLVLFLLTAQLAIAQTRPKTASSSHFKPGLRFDYFSRTVSWSDEETTSKLTSSIGSLVLEIEFRPGFSLAAILGYSSSAFDNVAFNKLPISIDFEGGGINGYVLGGEFNGRLLSGLHFGIDIVGQFLACLGANKKWNVPGLVVSGTVEGKPTWMHASIGPQFIYRGWKGFSPYLYPSLDYLWGTFTMKETIQTLSGEEKKDLRGKSFFGIALGANINVSPKFQIKGEAGFYPYQGGVDYSAMVKALISF
jgi:hypothetical protein